MGSFMTQGFPKLELGPGGKRKCSTRRWADWTSGWSWSPRRTSGFTRSQQILENFRKEFGRYCKWSVSDKLDSPIKNLIFASGNSSEGERWSVANFAQCWWFKGKEQGNLWENEVALKHDFAYFYRNSVSGNLAEFTVKRSDR